MVKYLIIEESSANLFISKLSTKGLIINFFTQGWLVLIVILGKQH
jgi:hypothetical protein